MTISILIQITGWIATIILILTMVPQVIKTVSSKKTQGISAISYGIAFAATSLFIIWSSAQDNLFVIPAAQMIKNGLVSVFVANSIVGILMLVVLYYVYKNNNKLYLFYLSVIFFIAIIIISILLYILGNTNGKLPSLSHNIGLSMFIPAGLGIGFAFAPQTVKTIKSKDAKNISLWTCIAFALTNFFWMLFYILEIAADYRRDYSFIFGVFITFIAIIWQLMLIYVKATSKKKKEKQKI